MLSYENTCIYKLIHKEDYDNLNIYIGSTVNFRARKCQHKNACCNPNNKSNNCKVYQYIRDNGGWDMWDMIEIEKYPCNDKRESLKREREIIDIFRPTLNTLDPYVSYEEKRERTNIHTKQDRINRPEIWAERDLKYYHKYKDITSEKRKNEKIRCECGC
jgi:hypothetical protein